MLFQYRIVTIQDVKLIYMFFNKILKKKNHPEILKKTYSIFHG